MPSFLSRRKGTIAAVAAVLLVPLGLLAVNSATSSAQGTAAAATPAASGFGVAPYVDLTNNQEPMVDSAISSGGLKAFTAAFVIGSGCTAIWGDTLPVTNDPTVSGDISRATSAGAQVIVSFGGAGGVELAQSCTNLTQLTAAYQSVINTYHLTHIDFDVEGAAIADPTSFNQRFKAIAALEAANPGLVVSVTIPVLPDGPDANGKTFLQAAKTDGARIDLINIMTMDFYGTWDTNAQMGAYSTQAAQATLTFAKTIWPSDTYANIGITPMIGQNDDPAEKFTEADAHTVVSFASSNGIGRLAFWSVDRDQPCAGSASGLPSCSEISQSKLDFTKIFTSFTGGGTGGGGTTTTAPPTTTTTAPPTTTTTTGSGGTGAAGCNGVAAWNSGKAYTGGATVTYNGHVWTAKWWTQADTPGGAADVWTEGAAC
jgi:hypothetical protein